MPDALQGLPPQALDGARVLCGGRFRRGLDAAFPAWAATDPPDRGRQLRALTGLVPARFGDLARRESAIADRPLRGMRAQMRGGLARTD